MIGGTFMQTLILVWVTYRTNWTKEVQIAITYSNLVLCILQIEVFKINCSPITIFIER
jgi:hypothetical protein